MPSQALHGTHLERAAEVAPGQLLEMAGAAVWGSVLLVNMLESIKRTRTEAARASGEAVIRGGGGAGGPLQRGPTLCVELAASGRMAHAPCEHSRAYRLANSDGRDGIGTQRAVKSSECWS